MKIDKATIASRATHASGKPFYKSYVKNISLSECRDIKGHLEGWKERDYFFSYKGKKYRVNQYIVPNKNGEVIGSAEYRYELKEITMKTLNDLIAYAESKGMSSRSIDRLLDEVETDGNGNMTEEYFNEFCFGIDCETEWY